jgi:hypothetical protein
MSNIWIEDYGGFPMNMTEIKKIATGMGIKPGRMKKTDLVRTIQEAEGNPTCFQTGIGEQCDQPECIWRSDCD